MRAFCAQQGIASPILALYDDIRDRIKLRELSARLADNLMKGKR